MIQFAAGATVIKELAGLLADVVEDGDTYKKIEGLRALISKATGVEIDKNGLVALLEQTTQGDAYTGEWEMADEHRRLRVDGGYLYDIGRGNAIFVADQ